MCRFAGVCNFNPETTVLAHIRRANVAGVGMKPPDICAVFACSACHDEIDRRVRNHRFAEIDADLLDALVRQLAWYSLHGHLVIVI